MLAARGLDPAGSTRLSGKHGHRAQNDIHTPWLQEVGIVVLLGVLALVIEHIYEAPVLAPLAVIGIYFLRHVFAVQHLRTCLRSPLGVNAVRAFGVWEFAYAALRKTGNGGKRHKSVRKKALKRFTTYTSALPDAVVLLDTNYCIDWINPAAERLLGLRKKLDYGKPISAFLREPGFLEKLNQDSFVGAVTVRCPTDIKMALSIRVVPAGKQRFLLQGRDITRISHLEQMRRDFVANVSHELRSPLTVVKGYTEALLERDRESTEGLESILRRIDQQAERMQRIVDDLLLLARLENGAGQTEDELVNIARLGRRIIEDAKSLAGTNTHDIQFQCDAGLGLAGQQEHLYTAFSNLVFNAVRFTPDGGSIRIEWAFFDGHAEFTVIDSGIGIDAQHLPRLPERFYRVDRARSRESGGTGLGLAITKHVLVNHDGRLLIESEPGKGSRFSCAFDSRFFRWTEVDGSESN